MHNQTMHHWVHTADAKRVHGEGNGRERGDGVDFTVYFSAATRRYIVSVYWISKGRTDWYSASTRAGAMSVGAHGWTPGYGPGSYTRLKRPAASREARQTSARAAARAAQAEQAR